MNENHQNGFTLYELLMTVLIIGVVLTVGIPNFRAYTANSKMTAAANDLHSSFQVARSEAARSKTNVSICSSTNGLDANPDCGGTFDDGWIVFVDEDGDVIRDAGEAVLRAYPPIPPDITITTPGAGTYFSYSATGLGRGNVGVGNAMSIAVMCDTRGNTIAAGGLSAARILVVTPIGRATVLREVSQVTAQGGCP
jgi:type IV fimbrial biogenesis protein FimT